MLVRRTRAVDWTKADLAAAAVVKKRPAVVKKRPTMATRPVGMMSGLQRSEVRTEVTPDELKEHIDTIEETYEFFLAYAAQGVSGSGTGISGELTNYLNRADQAVAAFEDGIGDAAEGQGAEAVAAMDRVLQRDAADTRAALRLVMAQPSISSQLIDNLNASIHFRALLTDLFLVDEALKASLAASG